MMLSGMLPLLVAQAAQQDLPMVIDGKVPIYPMMARAARIVGVVTMKVTTDGEKVTAVDTETGPAMLAKSARENVMTWKFLKHKPTTFETTFEYVLEEPAQCTYTNGSLVMNLPSRIHISAKGLKTCDPAIEIERNR